MRVSDITRQMTTIGLYNALPIDIPHVEVFAMNGVNIVTFDAGHNLSLSAVRSMHIDCVIVHTPFQSSCSVSYDEIRLIYVDVSELTETDIIYLVNTGHIAPRIDDSDVIRPKTMSTVCCNI